MKKLSRCKMDRLMRFFIDFAYSSAPGDEKILYKDSQNLVSELERLGLANRSDQALHVLAGYGLIEMEENRKSGQTTILLTNKGKAYFEQKRDARIAFWGKSVLLPILVSLITTIITVFILPSVGRQVEQWIQRIRSQQSQIQTAVSQPNDQPDSQPTISPVSSASHP